MLVCEDSVAWPGGSASLAAIISVSVSHTSVVIHTLEEVLYCPLQPVRDASHFKDSLFMQMPTITPVDSCLSLCGTETPSPVRVATIFNCTQAMNLAERLREHAGLPSRTPRIMPILNPNSGAGRSVKVFRSHILPALLAAGCSVDVRETAFSKHATELARLKDPNLDIDMLMCCGGDGLINEVINGNIEGRRLPVSVVPTGTDNALAASLGLKTVRMAILAAIKVVLVLVRAICL